MISTDPIKSNNFFFKKNFSPKKSPSKENLATIPDSFRQYRAQPNRDASDSEESNQSSNRSTCSSCSDFSDSRSGSDFG